MRFFPRPHPRQQGENVFFSHPLDVRGSPRAGNCPPAAQTLLVAGGGLSYLVRAMQLSLTEIVILAVVQGLTEFLPVSSSGHLVVLAALLADGQSRDLEVTDLTIVLHAGTLISILVFYWQRVWRLVTEDRRMIGLLIVGTLPAVAAGLPLMAAERLLSSPLLAGALLMVTGGMLLWAARLPVGATAYQKLTYGQALLIGVSQAVAILPGLSRSGATIVTGIRLGLTPRSAATFSFLLAIPAIAGASVLKIASLWRDATAATPPLHLAIGAAVSFVVGLAALFWLLRWIERGRLWYFAWWCLPLGAGVIVWQLWLLGTPPAG